MTNISKKEAKAISQRQKQITELYLRKLDNHIQNLKTGTESKALEINQFAEMLHIHPGHLSNTIKEVTGQSSCSLYEQRLVQIAKELLSESVMSIKEIAFRLTYDPSNFTKFFKTYTGITPKQYRTNCKI